MSVRTRYEIREHVSTATRETQIDSAIEDWINITLMEINDPAWAYEQIGLRGLNHLWTFNRRKHFFTTVASTEDYNLPRDVDKIGFVRQTTTPVKLLYIPDELFYEFIPDPTASSSAKYYRLWEEEGLSTSLAEDDTIDLVSSSASDGSTFTATVTGYDTNGAKVTEEYTLNGTSTVSGSQTFDAGRTIRVSKSGKTTGNITVTENSGGTTLVVLAPDERSPRFKVMSLYPIPSSAVTMYLEYYTRLKRLEYDAEVPGIDEKWIWVIIAGTMAKVYQYQGKEALLASTQAMYSAGVRSMVKADMQNVDYIPVLGDNTLRRVGRVIFSDLGYGTYGLNY